MLLSRTCEYGVRAMVYLASQESEEYLAVRSISGRLGISFHFLTKIFQQLTRSGLIQSFRGPNGGVKLSRPPGEITLRHIVDAIEGPGLFTECVLGLPNCGESRPCPLHDSWSRVRSDLAGVLDAQTLDRLGKDVVKRGLRLSGDCD